MNKAPAKLSSHAPELGSYYLGAPARLSGWPGPEATLATGGIVNKFPCLSRAEEQTPKALCGLHLSQPMPQVFCPNEVTSFLCGWSVLPSRLLILSVSEPNSFSGVPARLSGQMGLGATTEQWLTPLPGQSRLSLYKGLFELCRVSTIFTWTFDMTALSLSTPMTR